MAKKDMDVFTSRLTQTDLNDLIIKYNIPRDLHPRLPASHLVISDRLDDAIGIYHRMFDSLGIRISFSTFILSVIKHFKVHFSQVGFSKCSVNKKTGFFLIDRRAIPDYMSWRHPNSVTGSYNQSDVRRLSASIIKLCDIPEGVLVFSGLSKAHPLEASFYYTPAAAADVVIPTPTLKDLFAEAPNTKVLAKAEASKKRRASTSGSALSQVAKRTRSATTNFSRSSVRPNLFNDDSDDEESDDDPDACVKILLVTPICSVATIPLGGKAIIKDVVDTPSRSVGRSQAFTGPTPTTRDPTGDAIDRDSFPSSLVSNLKKEVLDLNDKVTASDVSFVNANAKGKDQKKKIKSLSKSLDQFTAKATRLASDLNQAWREGCWDSSSLFLSFEVVFRVWFGGSLLVMSLIGFKIVDHFACPLFPLIELKPDRLARSSAVLTLKVVGVFLYFLKELTMKLASSLMELVPKDAPPTSVATTKQHSHKQDKEWLTTMVDTADEDMFHAASSKLVEVLVRCVLLRVCEDVNRVKSSSIQDLRFAYSGSPNVIVALFVGKEKESAPPNS
nr:hypothetical protein [Tanacetum cinerariifolium]